VPANRNDFENLSYKVKGRVRLLSVMSENTNMVITKYLLGALSESETERLDELSFTDDQFAESLLSAEKDLVDAYVQGELSGMELERFNSYYLSTSMRREKTAFARALQKLDEKESPDTGSAPKSAERQGRRLPLFERLWTPRLAWGLGAAILVMLIGGGLLLFQNLRLRQQIADTQGRREALLQRERELQAELSHERSTKAEAERELTRLREEQARLENEQGGKRPSIGPSVFSFILAPPLRGVGNIPSFSIPAKTQTVSIQLGVESTNASGYRVSLIDPSSHLLWRSGTLKLRARNRNLKISFPASLLKPQTYVLRVVATRENGTSEIIGDYPFRVVG
jgi:hypothetical protein